MPRMSLELVVVAIVILVVALVVLTIFGTGIAPIADITTAKSQCSQAGAATCSSIGQLPGTWNAKTVVYRTGATTAWESCAVLLSCIDTCDNCKFSKGQIAP
jgi:hypothetical protein